MRTIYSVVATSFAMAAILGTIAFALYLPFFIREHKKSVPASTDHGALIRALRIASLLVLLVGWPILTFLVPFLFTTEAAFHTFHTQAVMATYVLYPFSHFVSAYFFRRKLMENDRRAACIWAAAPLILLALASTAFGLT